MKNLYIIGNGFDLHHDIKSSYGHFSNWLRENDNTVYQEMINLYGEEIVNGDWWNDFESNLGYLNFREIIEHHSWHNQPSDEDIEKTVLSIQWVVLGMFNQMWEKPLKV